MRIQVHFEASRFVRTKYSRLHSIVLRQAESGSKRPGPFVPKVPVHGFDRDVFVQALLSELAPFFDSIARQHVKRERRGRINSVPIPLCFLPPNGTLLCMMLYWFTQTYVRQEWKPGDHHQRSGISNSRDWIAHRAGFQR